MKIAEDFTEEYASGLFVYKKEPIPPQSNGMGCTPTATERHRM